MASYGTSGSANGGTGAMSSDDVAYVRLHGAPGDTDSEYETPKSLKGTESSPLLTSPKPTCYLPRRYVIGFCLWIVLTIGYAYRSIMSIAVLTIKTGQSWENDETVQGLVLCSFFVGYILTQIIGGELARRYGAKIVYTVFFSTAAVATLLLPVMGPSLPMIYVMRIFTGMGEGILFPGTHALVSYWVPASERATLLTAIWSGTNVGQLIALGTTQLIIDRLGWPAVFYIWGAAGIAWVLLWILFGGNSPTATGGIMQRSILRPHSYEVNHLVSEIPALTAAPTKTPWFALLTSTAVWAIAAAHFSTNWTLYVLLSFLPKFLHSLDFDPGSYGLLPYIGSAIVSVIAGKLADLTITKFKVQTVWVRRIWQTIGALGASLFLALIAGLVKTKAEGIMAVSFLVCAVSIGGFVSSGYGANHIDIGPKYAGPLMGITNTVATIPGIVGVFLTGFILDKTHGSYTIVWILGIAIYAVGTLLFFIGAKGHKLFD